MAADFHSQQETLKIHKVKYVLNSGLYVVIKVDNNVEAKYFSFSYNGL